MPKGFFHLIQRRMDNEKPSCHSAFREAACKGYIFLSCIMKYKQIFPLLIFALLLACAPLSLFSPEDNSNVYSYEEEESSAGEQGSYDHPELGESTPSASVFLEDETGQWLNEFDEYMQEKFTAEDIPGMSVTLVNSEGLVYAQGFGLRDVQHNLPVTPDTLFHIGSTQKSMTAMLVASLVDDGYFTWDTPVVEIIPEFELSDPQAAQEVTFRHLLSMRAGIPEEAEDDLDYEGSLEDVLDAAYHAHLIAAPGDQFEYSNLSATLAGYIATAAVYGTAGDIHSAYTKLFEERVLEPIGMTRASMYLSEARQDGNFSLSYEVSRSGEALLTETYDTEKDILAPSGSLKASAVEMGYYIQTQLRRGNAPDGQQIVSEENLTETWIPYLEDYAMGWDVKDYDVKTILHEGAYDDFISVIGFMPEENIGFVILINSEMAGEDLIIEAPKVLAELLVE